MKHTSLHFILQEIILRRRKHFGVIFFVCANIVKHCYNIVYIYQNYRKKVCKTVILAHCTENIHEGITKTNPVLVVKSPKQQPTKVAVFTKEEI